MRTSIWCFSLLAAWSFAAPPLVRAADTVIVYDASNSMWGQIEGEAKITIARRVMGDLLRGWDDATQVGLVAYGHRRAGDCSDIETVARVGELSREALIEQVEGLQPTGKTPLTAALQHAAEALRYRDNPATVILISDGIESCNADPCAASEALSRAGIRFTAHVVGFDVGSEEDQSQLRCIADNTGGRFFAARNAEGLEAALQEAAEIASEAEPRAPEVVLDAPEQAVAGSLVRVGWKVDDPQPGDVVTIAAAGEPWRTGTDQERVHDRRQADVTAPGHPGAHEVVYVSSATGKAVARRPLSLTEPASRVAAPATVIAGASLRVTWSDNIHPEDYVTLVPVDAPDKAYDDYVKVRDVSEGTLTASGTPGEYEARYVLRSGRRVLSRTPVTVTEARAGITAPAEVTAGATYKVSWDTAIHPEDYVTLVPVGAPDKEYDDYVKVRDGSAGTLTAPGTPGEYEARYVLREDRSVLARVPVTVVAARAAVTAPDQVTGGARFTVSWDTVVNDKDYITIVPADAADSEYENYVRAADGNEGTLVAPAKAGAHEVRYVLREGRVVLSRVPVDVQMPEVAIDGPTTIAAGETFDVQWNTAVHPRDYVTIVPAEAAPNKYGDYVNVGSKMEGRLTAPDAPGAYEVRYVLREGRTPVGRLSVRVAEAAE